VVPTYGKVFRGIEEGITLTKRVGVMAEKSDRDRSMSSGVYNIVRQLRVENVLCASFRFGGFFF
jgi:hypothetical protein